MLTVHYFTAPWCGPCKTFGPRLEAFAAQNNVEIVKHNADSDHEAVQEFGVMSIPSTFWFDQKGLIATKIGPLTETQMQQIVR